MGNRVVNLDPEGNVTAFKEDDGSCKLHYTVDDCTFDKLEISQKLFNMIVEEFGEREWNK